MSARHRNQKGFTLLELLVMLVVLGLLMATLTQGVRLEMQSNVIESRMQAGTTDLEATARLLRELVAKASPGDPAALDAVFLGTPHAASFITILPDGFGAVATHEAEVSIGVGAGHRLEFRWRPYYRRWITTPPPPRAMALLDGVERLDLSFWQAGSGSAPGQWVSAWAGRELPRLVRLRVVFAAGDQRHWPDIIAAPMRELPRP